MRHIAPEAHARLAGDVTARLGEGQPAAHYEVEAVRLDGTRVWLENRVSLFTWEGRPAFLMTVFDVTERRRAQQRAETQFAVTRVLVESVALHDAAPRLLEAIGEGIGWDLGDLFVIDAGSGHMRWESSWSRAIPGADEFVAASRPLTLAAGHGLPGRVLASGHPEWLGDIAVDPDSRRGAAAATAGLRTAFAFPIRSQGDVKGVLEFFSRDRRDPDGQLVQMMGDIGHQLGQFLDRVAMEQAFRQSEERLRQSQKMEAIGQLAGGVAHDFNNLLTVITGRGELVLDAFAAADPVRSDVELILQTAERAAALTRQLLAFSRRQVLQPKVLDLNVLVGDMGKLLRRLIGEDIEVSLGLARDLGLVRVDPGQIEQVLMNLVVNARDAMPHGGRLVVETANVDITEGEPGSDAELRPGPYVQLAVGDSGVGMDPSTQARIFEPFFTTKGPGKGTGLGLATVYGIVKQSGGHIAVESAVGRGTTFRVSLPRVEPEPELPEVQTPRAKPASAAETVLLVEDDDPVRAVATDILRRAGYVVVACARASEALERAERHPGPIHVLVTDIVMPDVSGIELARRVKALRPETRVLYMSGYTEGRGALGEALDARASLLDKPFRAESLVRKLHEVLDA
jgi:signal transduction histidine kinase/CheY-like chemotaxis protein